MSTVAIAVIAYAGGALTMYLARRIGETSDRYPRVTWSGGSIDGHETCSGCGVVLYPGRVSTHYYGCPTYFGIRGERVN